MFTWICPKCGAEVPPSYSECPQCASKSSAAPQPQTATPPVQPAAPPPPARAARRLSPTLVAIFAAAGIVALLCVLYLYVLPHSSQVSSAPSTSLQLPGAAGSSESAHPLAKHLELAGLRVTQSAGQTVKIQFLAINHSAADLPDLKMHITLRALSGGNPIFEFPVDLLSIGPYESREVTSTVKTTLKAYEIPDWQMLRGEFRLPPEL